MSFTQQNVNYCSSAQYSLVTAWATGAAKSVGNLVRQTAPSVGNERIWVCIIAGTTHATTEPTWTTGRGDKITDNTVTWMEITGLPAFNGDITSTPNWVSGAKSTNVSNGHCIKDAAGTHIFLATTANANAGTGAEPTWNTAAVGNTTVDASVTWTYMGTSFGAWAAPHQRTARALQANWTDTSPTKVQTVFVGSDHAETQSSSFSWPVKGTSNTFPTDILCVNVAGSLPPVSADLRTTATVSVTGSSQMDIGNGAYRIVYGITFNNGTSGNVSLQWNLDNNDRYYENCTFNLPSGTGSAASFQFNGINCVNYFKGCTFGFTNAGHSMTNGYAEFDNCTFSGTTPTTLINGQSQGRFVFRNCDFSAFGTTTLFTGTSIGALMAHFRDCKLPTTTTLTSFSGPVNRDVDIILSRCSSAGNEYHYQQSNLAGTIEARADIARATGGSDGGTPISYKCATSAFSFLNGGDLRPPLMATWNPTTAANVTVTVYGIVNAAAVPTNIEAHIDLDYLGTSGNTIGTRASSRIADTLAAPAGYTADTSDWTAGTVAARQNTHTYSVGDVIKVASNPGRVFFCTASSGNTAGAEPGGYASAVDGGSVTDGSATFRAGCRFKMALTLSAPQPQIAGFIYCQAKFAKVSTTVYIDPFIVLT
jgi:hypothetical protein